MFSVRWVRERARVVTWRVRVYTRNTLYTLYMRCAPYFLFECSTLHDIYDCWWTLVHLHFNHLLFLPLCKRARMLQINQFVVMNRNVFTAQHETRQLRFCAKSTHFHRPNHSNGHSTTRPRHSRCHKVNTEFTRRPHQLSRIHLSR